METLAISGMLTAISWRKVRLGELIAIKHGYAFKGEYFSDTGTHVVLTPGNFHDEGGFKHKGGKEKWYTGPIPKDFVLRAGDLIVAMTEQAEGLLGSSAFVPNDDQYLHNQRLGLVQILDPDLLDKYFLYYLFNTQSVRVQIRATANGAKVRHTSPSRIYEVIVDLPDVSVQRRIASILGAYDDLIENNLWRIRILEEMARILYKEWFVDFRFPGHEKHGPRPASNEACKPTRPNAPGWHPSSLGPIPTGWKVKELGEMVTQECKGVNPDTVDPDTPYVGLEHIPRKSIALFEWGRASDVDSMKYRFQKGDILFGKIRPYFHKVSVAHLDGICSSDTIVIRSRSQDFFGPVLCCVSSAEFVDQATQTSNGTKMPRANWKVLVKYPLAIPPSALLERFTAMICDIVTLIHNLVAKNVQLRHTRNLLLPKLISGEILVTGTDAADEMSEEFRQPVALAAEEEIKYKARIQPGNIGHGT